jgi:hypothetical protein
MTRRFPQVTLLCPQLLRWPHGRPARSLESGDRWAFGDCPARSHVRGRPPTNRHRRRLVLGSRDWVQRQAIFPDGRKGSPATQWARRSARECDGGAKADRQCISEYPAGGMVDDSAFSVVALVLRRRSVVLGRSRFILRRLDRRRGRDPRYRQNVLHVVREPISSRFYDLPNRASAGIGSDISIGQARAVRATPQLSSPRRCQLTRLGVGV